MKTGNGTKISWMLLGMFLLVPGLHSQQARPTTTENSLTVFNRRILPILQSKKRTSCFECHFSGVDLKDFIHESQEKTFASLRKAGMIDLKKPDDSKILEFIQRKPAKPNPITDKARQMEYDAFRAWINAAVKNPQLLKVPGGDDVGIRVPLEVIRHARKDLVLSRFIDNVWSQIGRCVSCHSPGHNQKLVAKFGQKMNWIVPNDPKATLERIAHQELIDLDHPDKSQFLLKPAGLMKHVGGPKFVPGGTTWHQYLQFLLDYTSVVKGIYSRTDELPKKDAEIAYMTKHFLRITGVPRKYHKLPVKVDIYRGVDGGWSKHRWATCLNYVVGFKQFWQGALDVTAPGNSARAEEIRKKATLPPGKYLAKIYMDRNKRILKEPSWRMGEKEFVGQIVIEGGWRTGFKTPRIVKAPASWMK